MGAVRWRWRPAVRGTFSCAVVRRVLCALLGFPAPGGRCCLAPVLVPWLWPVACLSVVPCGPALVRRASSGPVALHALVGFPVAVVPSATTEGVAPGFTGWLRGALGGWPGTGLFVSAAGPCRGRGAGLAPRRTRSGPRDGVVPGGSLRLRSWAAYAAVVGRVWTRSLTRPVSRTVRLSTGESAGAPGLFCVDAATFPFGSEDATAGSGACVRVHALRGRVVRTGLPGAFWCASPFLWPFCPSALFGPLGAGVALSCPFVCLSRCFPSFFPFPSRAPVVSGFLCFLSLGAVRLGALRLPHPVFFPFCFLFPFRRPLVSGFPLFPALGALGLCGARPPSPLARFLCFGIFGVFFVAFLMFRGSRRSWFLLRLPGFLFPLPCAALCAVRALCAGAVPPPLRWLLVYCCVSCRVVWCCGLFWAGLCGSRLFFGAVLCLCRAVWRVVVLCCWCCRWRSSFGVVSSCFVGVVRCPVVPCCFVRSLSCLVPSHVVACCVVLSAVLVRGVVWSLGPLRGFPDAAWCRCLVPCRGLVFVSCPAVRCCVVPLCRLPCAVLLFASFLAGGALLLRSRQLVPCVVDCGCWVFVAGFGCPLLFSSGVPGVVCLCSCLAAWLAALLRAVVCCGVSLPCAVSCGLRCCVAVWCRAVVPCCPFCFAGGVGLCPFPLSAVLRCAVRVAVRCRFGLCCRWRLSLWCVAVCGAVSLGVPWCGGAALLRGLVCRGVVLCRVVSCGALLPCGAVLLDCAACSPCGWSFLLSLLSGVLVRCSVMSCALCYVLRCCAALWCCAGWLCCAVACAAGFCFSFCPLPLC